MHIGGTYAITNKLSVLKRFGSLQMQTCSTRAFLRHFYFMPATITIAKRKEPHSLIIADDGLVYAPHTNCFLLLSDLEKLKTAIDSTIDMYKKLGVVDEVVTAVNKKFLDEEYNRYMEGLKP